jgi:hypothetical protein
MAYTDAFNQDADAVFKVKHYMVPDENGMKHSEIHMYAPGLREGTLDGLVINGVPCTNFDFKRIIVEKDEEQEEDQYGKKHTSAVPSSTFSRDKDFYKGPDPKVPNPK